MTLEIKTLGEQLTDKTEMTVQGMRFTTGSLKDRRVVLAHSGMGKVNAAMAAFTFPIPEWASTTLLSFKLPVVNRIPWTVISVLSVSCSPSVLISKVIALSTAMTAWWKLAEGCYPPGRRLLPRVAGGGRRKRK